MGARALAFVVLVAAMTAPASGAPKRHAHDKPIAYSQLQGPEVTGPSFLTDAHASGEFSVVPTLIADALTSTGVTLGITSTLAMALHTQHLSGFVSLPTFILQGTDQSHLVSMCHANPGAAGSSSAASLALGPPAMQCVQEQLALFYGGVIDWDASHFRLFAGRDGTSVHTDGVSVHSRLCFRLHMESNGLPAAPGHTSTIRLEDPAATTSRGRWWALPLESGRGFLFSTAPGGGLSFGHRVSHHAVCDPAEGTRVVTVVLDLTPAPGRNSLRSGHSEADIAATAQAILDCVEHLPGAFPSGLPTPLPEDLSAGVYQLFTHGNGHPQNMAGSANTHNRGVHGIPCILPRGSKLTYDADGNAHIIDTATGEEMDMDDVWRLSHEARRAGGFGRGGPGALGREGHKLLDDLMPTILEAPLVGSRLPAGYLESLGLTEEQAAAAKDYLSSTQRRAGRPPKYGKFEWPACFDDATKHKFFDDLVAAHPGIKPSAAFEPVRDRLRDLGGPAAVEEFDALSCVNKDGEKVSKGQSCASLQLRDQLKGARKRAAALREAPGTCGAEAEPPLKKRRGGDGGGAGGAAGGSSQGSSKGGGKVMGGSTVKGGSKAAGGRSKGARKGAAKVHSGLAGVSA